MLRNQFTFDGFHMFVQSYQDYVIPKFENILCLVKGGWKALYIIITLNKHI